MKNTIAKLATKLTEYGQSFNSFAPTEIGGVPVQYPYSVFDFSVPVTSFKTQSGDLTIDIWSDSMGEAIDLADSIWKGLDEYTYSDANTSFYIRQLIANTVPDEDVNIHRRQLTFLVLFEEV